MLLGTASLAYAFGLRHGVDPDHIAAIDNVTRKLMQEGRRPLTSGLFFALGHSTVVVIASVLVALSVAALQARFDRFREIGGMIGTSVSALFLLAIALANIVDPDLGVSGLPPRSGAASSWSTTISNEVLAQRGLLGRLLRSLFGLITKSWHMYPLGLLFGLGFDTASEVGLLGISAAQGSAGLPVWSILVFPALFTAGMALVDTADGMLMVDAYGWAFMKPIRKLYYNLTITLVSIVVALSDRRHRGARPARRPAWPRRRVLGFDRRAERSFRRAGLSDRRHLRGELAGLGGGLSAERIRPDRGTGLTRHIH